MWKHSLSLSADTSLCQSMKQFSVEDKELLSRVWWYEAGKTVPLKAKWAPPWMRERLLWSRGMAWRFGGEEQRARAGKAGKSQRTTHRAVLHSYPPHPPCLNVDSQGACWNTGHHQRFLLWCALLESKNLILAVFILWAISTVPETKWTPNKGFLDKRMTEWMDWRMDGWMGLLIHSSILRVLSLHSQKGRICKFRSSLGLFLQMSSSWSHDCISNFEPLKVNAGRTFCYSRARSNDKTGQNCPQNPFQRYRNQPKQHTKVRSSCTWKTPALQIRSYWTTTKQP